MLKNEGLRERVARVEAEIKVLTEIAGKLPDQFARIWEEFANLRKEVADEFSRVREEFSRRFDRIEQKMDKLMWWVLGVMFALLIAVIFRR